MSAEDCDHHSSFPRRSFHRLLFAFLLSLIVLILLIIFIIWLVLRPTKPKFLLQDTSVYLLNLSAPNLLSSYLQITISSQNPNDRIGIYYERNDAFAEYKNQQITAATTLPAGYQGHNDVNIWSPNLYGTAVPIAPFLVDAMRQDENAGFVLIYIKIDGRLRWKVGSWISGHYHIDVSCPAFLTVDASKGKGRSSPYRFQEMTACSVDV